MRDNKHWYEKVNIWIGIIAGITTIIVGIITIGNSSQNSNQNINNFDKNTITADNGDVIINLGDTNNFIKESSDDNKISESNININSLKLDYAALSDDRFKNVYIGEYTDLSNPEEKYYLENNCAFILNISNPTDHQIKINKFRIVTNNINQVTDPFFGLYLTTSDSGVGFLVSNEGWGNAYNIELTIDDNDHVLAQYYNQEDLLIKISELKFGETVWVPFPGVDKLIKKPNIDNYEYISIYPFIQIEINDKIESFQNFIPIYLYNDKVLIDAIGGNDGFYGVYGIMIDSNLNMYQKEFNVNETIDKGEILDIPICFFPNKSSYMDFHVEFDIFNGSSEETVSSEIKRIEFNVSSTEYQYVNYDNSIVDLQDMYNNTVSKCYISYPDNKNLNPLNSY